MGISSRGRLLLTGVVCLFTLFSVAGANAASANLSRSYRTTQKIPKGSLVSLDAKKSDFVELANRDNGTRVLGLAVASNDSLLAVNASASKVQVAINGTATALVSTFNGAIKVGDKVAVSPFNGIGMKAENGSHYVGLAQTAFSDKSPGASRQEVKDTSGKAKTVYLGYTRVALDVGVNNTSSGNSQTVLQRFARSFTGKAVSNVRIILSLVVTIVALIILITLIYGAIYGSIIAVGRNPLAKHAIFRSIGAVMGMVILTAVTASTIIFFLLG